MSRPAGERLEVSADYLRAVAAEFVDHVDAMHRHARRLGGAQDGLNGAPAAFDSARALAEVESGWQAALHTVNTKAAADADTLAICADSYAAAEEHATGLLMPR